MTRSLPHDRSTETAAKHAGMGAIPHEKGVAFRVWAPHADSVSVIGSFNDFKPDRHPMSREDGGNWYADLPDAAVGDEYRYQIVNGDKTLSRIDPRARQVTNSIGNGVIHNPHFDWEDDAFVAPPHDQWVIYEMHVGTFSRKYVDKTGTFDDMVLEFDHLKHLGVNVLQLMPVAEFAGDISWGYNPAHLYAIESAYGGPEALKRFVKTAHREGFAVVMDVVYNHFGPSDLDLWQFDGWSENGKGGIYFYNDFRSKTPWGDTRPDYGRGEVRSFIYDNAMMWIEDFHIDGLRYDMTLYIRSLDASGRHDIPDGWGLTQWINRSISDRYPHVLTIAEDLQDNPYLTKSDSEGGAHFSAQWDARFVHPIRDVLTKSDDRWRSMQKVVDAILHQHNGDVFQRVVYTESHDEVANGKSRMPAEIDHGNPENWFAQKRSTLGAALVFTAPGIPMIFQGQEFLQGGWFIDTEELDWDNRDTFHGIVWLYADLIRLRRNHGGVSKGLTGQHTNVFHVNDDAKVVAYHRSSLGGPGDDVVVVTNFSNREFSEYRIGLPRSGQWKLRFNSDWKHYSDDFSDCPSGDLKTDDHPYDGLRFSAVVHLAPYTAIIYSQDAAGS